MLHERNSNYTFIINMFIVPPVLVCDFLYRGYVP